MRACSVFRSWTFTDTRSRRCRWQLRDHEDMLSYGTSSSALRSWLRSTSQKGPDLYLKPTRHDILRSPHGSAMECAAVLDVIGALGLLEEPLLPSHGGACSGRRDADQAVPLASSPSPSTLTSTTTLTPTSERRYDLPYKSQSPRVRAKHRRVAARARRAPPAARMVCLQRSRGSSRCSVTPRERSLIAARRTRRPGKSTSAFMKARHARAPHLAIYQSATT
jgi:hypothetical protein